LDESINGTKPHRKYFESLDDFIITTINNETRTGENRTPFWQINLNFRPTQVGGCQQKVKEGDQVLFAVVSDTTTARLRLTGPRNAVAKTPVQVMVTNENGAPVQGAWVRGEKTNSEGIVSTTFTNREMGFQRFKAMKENTVRSNALEIRVIPSSTLAGISHDDPVQE